MQLGIFDAPNPPEVTCFSLWQPYAGLVAAGLKTLETRPRPWPETARPYPSQLLICSTAGDAVASFGDRVPEAHRLDADLWRKGIALALVDVVGCRLLTAEDEPRSWYWDPDGDKAAGITRWAWELANVRRVRPFKVSGLQGFARKVPRADVEAHLIGGA